MILAFGARARAQGGVYASGVKRGARGSQADVVERLLRKVERKLADDADVKATVGDYIRLLQLQKELQDEEPREIEVRWIDPEKLEKNPDGGE